MIRPTTLVTIIIAACLGFALFKVKYEVQAQEDQLFRVERQIANEEAAIHVLRANWSTETQPQTLGTIALRHMALKPMTAAQLGNFDTLPLAEHPPGPAADPAATPADKPAAPALVASVPAPPQAPAPSAEEPAARGELPIAPQLHLASLHHPEAPAHPGASRVAIATTDPEIAGVLQAMRLSSPGRSPSGAGSSATHGEAGAESGNVP